MTEEQAKQVRFLRDWANSLAATADRLLEGEGPAEEARDLRYLIDQVEDEVPFTDLL